MRPKKVDGGFVSCRRKKIKTEGRKEIKTKTKQTKLTLLNAKKQKKTQQGG